MTDNEYLAYIAGIFDGEGCVALVRQCNAPMRRPRISIAQKNQHAFFEEVQARWGGRVWMRKDNVEQWITDAVPAIQSFLTDILPWLRFKKEKAIIALAMCQYCGETGKHLTDEARLGRAILENKFDEAVVKSKGGN